VPFHRAVLEAPEFVAADGQLRVFTTWIETEFADTVAGLGKAPAPGGDVPADDVATERVVVEVGGKRLEVVLPASLAQAGRARSGGPARPSGRRPNGAAKVATGADLASPMQGTIVKVAVEEGASVAEGDLVVVLEAMKMEQPLTAHRSGTVKALTATVGGSVSAGTVICQIVPDEPSQDA
jgi:acetyl-CoA/propionyl-CoA carboxylase biotin carboxyl carrier protein